MADIRALEEKARLTETLMGRVDKNCFVVETLSSLVQLRMIDYESTAIFG